MKNKKLSLTDLFKAAPLNAIPRLDSQPFVLLSILADGQVHTRESLVLQPLLGESLRSAIQSLRGDGLRNWHIISVPLDNGKTGLQLDPRHLLGDPELDSAARRERRKQLKRKSHKDAVQGRKREPKAFKELSEAEKEFLKGLGQSANDSEMGE